MYLALELGLLLLSGVALLLLGRRRSTNLALTFGAFETLGDLLGLVGDGVLGQALDEGHGVGDGLDQFERALGQIHADLGAAVLQAKLDLTLHGEVQGELGAEAGTDAEEAEVDAEFGVDFSGDVGLDLGLQSDLHSDKHQSKFNQNFAKYSSTKSQKLMAKQSSENLPIDFTINTGIYFFYYFIMFIFSEENELTPINKYLPAGESA